MFQLSGFYCIYIYIYFFFHIHAVFKTWEGNSPLFGLFGTSDQCERCRKGGHCGIVVASPGVSKMRKVLCDRKWHLAETERVVVIAPTTVSRAQAVEALVEEKLTQRLLVVGHQKLTPQEAKIALVAKAVGDAARKLVVAWPSWIYVSPSCDTLYPKP